MSGSWDVGVAATSYENSSDLLGDCRRAGSRMAQALSTAEGNKSERTHLLWVLRLRGKGQERGEELA